jgi:hypothetical protein
MRSFIQWFPQVCNTIPRISNASVVVAFCQGVRDEKMLKKVTTRDIQDVAKLFSLAVKCARAVPGTPYLAWKQARIASPTRGLLLRAATTTTTRKPVATTSHWLVPPLLPPPLLWLVKAEGHEVTSAPIRCSTVMTMARDARYKTSCATVRVRNQVVSSLV